MTFFYYITIESQKNIEIIIKRAQSEFKFKNTLLKNILKYFKE